ncbi:hypothetical protein, partial [Xanthomonas oryzae]|uniref:hypothetical protein n=1 Tax=Xanthomonas oryzae TaxID=347 RepID=UPI001C673B6D
ALHTLPRARFAYGKQLPWLKDGANQDPLSDSSKSSNRGVPTIAKEIASFCRVPSEYDAIGACM